MAKASRRTSASTKNLCANWRRSLREIPGLAAEQELGRLPHRLAAAAVALNACAHPAPAASSKKRAHTGEKANGHLSESQHPLHTLIHGDFKAENLFFNHSGDSVTCGAVDFQWAGGGMRPARSL